MPVLIPGDLSDSSDTLSHPYLFKKIPNSFVPHLFSFEHVHWDPASPIMHRLSILHSSDGSGSRVRDGCRVATSGRKPEEDLPLCFVWCRQQLRW